MFLKIESEKNNQIKQIQTFTKHSISSVIIHNFKFCLFIIQHVQEEQSNFYQERTFIKSLLKSECLFFSNSEQSSWNHVLKKPQFISEHESHEFLRKRNQKRGLLLLLLLKLKKNVLSKQFWTRFYGPGAHFARSDIGKLCAKMHQLDFADH